MRFLPESVSAVKAKRELAALDDAFVSEKIKKLLLQDKRTRKKIEDARSFKELSRSATFKDFVKQVRAELRVVYGVFDVDEKKERVALLSQLRKRPADPDIHRQLLLLHQSAKERISYYNDIYWRIFSITGQPASIVDLGCGANPYSYFSLGCAPRYVAVDLPNEELARLQEFFTLNKIKGTAIGLDLVSECEKLAALERADVAFLFKTLDSLEAVKKNSSGRVLDEINATWIVVSFPTMSLGGKKHIPAARRAWFERLVRRKGWYSQTFEIGGEAFFLLLKEPEELSRKRYARDWKPLIEKFEQFDLTKECELFRERLPRGKVLDLGCGGGRDAAMLTRNGYHVTGLDASPEMVRAARIKAPSATFVVGDMRALPFGESEFDGLWCLSVLVHSYDATALQVLRECSRVLRPSGVLLLSVKEGAPVLRVKNGEPVFYRRYSEEEIVALVRKAGFDINKIHRVAVLNESQIDPFLDLICQKPVKRENTFNP
jgi:16S rRNA (guanine(1405)-N(7))-methyltransferase